MLDVNALAVATGSPDRAARLWPYAVQALQRFGLDTQGNRLALAANALTESALALIPEGPSDVSGDRFQNYEPGTRVGQILGNTVPGDGAKFRGRGPIQISGRDNYTRIGQKIGAPLADDPDLLLVDPAVSLEAAVTYLAGRGAFAAASVGNWEQVRRAVQPGNDPGGMARYLRYLGILQANDPAAAAQAPLAQVPGSSGVNPKFLAVLVGFLVALWRLR